MTDASQGEPSTQRSLPPWWAVLLVALAIAGLAFAIGRFSTFGSAASAPGTDSAEAGFARDMQLHHAQAIEMSMTIYRKTQDENVRMLSHDIATAQSAQRGEFYDWLVKWGLPQGGGRLMSWMDAADTGHDHGGTAEDPATDEELMASMGMASTDELAQLDAATGTEADCLYLGLMIRHHEGALPMAEALLELGSEPRALQVADGIIATQSAEIDLMQSLRAGLACEG